MTPLLVSRRTCFVPCHCLHFSCGWYAPALAELLAARFHAPGIPRLTPSGLVALLAELRDEAIVLAQVAECMRSTLAERGRYTARYGGAAPFVPPNVDPAAGDIVAPSDERTISGFMGQEAGPWELSHWLRTRDPASATARRVGILRQVCVLRVRSSRCPGGYASF